MKRLLPFPWMSLFLLVLWLLLNQSIEPVHLLFGACLGIATPLLTRKLQPLGYPRLAKPLTFVRLMSMALVEIVRSCISVSRIILFVKPAEVKSQFIKVPLDIRNPYGLAMLSCLINSTPGTVWVEILGDRHELALHVFDLHDEQWWIETIKERYEKPLIEIFE
ncbi:Na+/H+ antiporter subunit E [Noviherbaspirillum sp. Root189]|uniref:Na+/H+ antiporter subunit E n=1 Tax=Noviherbaspirillum sp. Root189 TaxID=1736487 RepID=UPI00070B1BA0|nr:Na+/H+ antiporter subunit E [Noviherbaspirillum sp. Root189]KRB84013.1 pesticidal protein Cry1Ia [Noviherbaspirillum sp. Root189]